MKTLIAVCLFAPLFAVAGDEPQKKPESAKPAAKAAAKRSASTESDLPAGAVLVDTNTWHWKAPDGKTWLYRRTPFGLSRGVIEEKPKLADEIPPGMIAIDAGDSVRFERPSPFGPLKWTKSKSELTELEQLVWERDHPKPAAIGAETKPPTGAEEKAEKDKAKQ